MALYKKEAVKLISLPLLIGRLQALYLKCATLVSRKTTAPVFLWNSQRNEAAETALISYMFIAVAFHPSLNRLVHIRFCQQILARHVYLFPVLKLERNTR